MVFIRKVELRMKEQKKYEVIKKLKETNGNKKRAAVELGCKVRHVNRMLKGYETQGKEFFSHGNKGRRPASALSEELKESILLLYQNKYYDSTLRISQKNWLRMKISGSQREPSEICFTLMTFSLPLHGNGLAGNSKTS